MEPFADGGGFGAALALVALLVLLVYPHGRSGAATTMVPRFCPDVSRAGSDADRAATACPQGGGPDPTPGEVRQGG